MENVIGIIFPAAPYDIYQSIGICRQIEEETGNKWSFIVKKGRLIYFIDYVRTHESENKAY